MSMARNLVPVPPSEQGPGSTPSGHFRDRIARRSQEQDQRFPAAVDLEAQVVMTLHGVLTGHGETLRGIHSGDHFRSLLLGDRALHLSDLCRLATSEHPRAREAAIAALRTLAAALDQNVVPLERRNADAFEAISAAVETAGSFAAAAVQAGRDGYLDDAERRDLAERIDEQVARLTLAKGTL